MEREILFAFCVFAFVMSVTPGPNNLMLMASGTNFGFRRSMPHMLGIVSGCFIMFLLAGFGAAELFLLFPVSYTILKVLSVFYLSYLAFKIFVSAFHTQENGARLSYSKPFSFFEAFLFQWMNPKAWVMVITAISSYMSSSSSFLTLLVVSLVFVLVMLPSISVWAFMGQQIQRFLNRSARRKVFNFVVSLLLLASLYLIVLSPAFD